MKEQDEIRRLNERIEALEQELRTAKQVTWMGLTAGMWLHEIQGQAVTIRDCVALIRRVEAGNLPKRVDEYLDWINKAAAVIHGVPITPPSPSEVTSISVGEFLAEYARTIHVRKLGHGLDVRLESPTEARVKVSPIWLRQCVDLIVENAEEAMRDSPDKVLTIGAAVAGEWVEIYISDTGPGVPDTIRPQLLRTPVRATDRQEHLGFGLLIAKTIMQAFSGDVRLDEMKQDGAMFIISLPKA